MRAQIQANRANAQFSTGTRTQAGKDAVAQNAAAHGLSSPRFAILPCENPAEFQALVSALVREYAPDSATETFEEMARAQWKLERAVAIESELLSGSDDSSVRTPLTFGPNGFSRAAVFFPPGLHNPDRSP